MSTTEVPRSAPPEQDGLTDIEVTAYHADRGSLSVSGAKLLLPPSCPAKFKQAMDEPPKPRAIYDFGHLVHSRVLGEGATIAVLDPAVHGLKKDGTVADNPTATSAWKAADAEARLRGELPVHIDDFTRAQAMAETVRVHPIAGPLFERGHAEKSMYHTDPETGVRLRGRPDWLTTVDGRLICVDYKTSATAEPGEMERPFWKYGYCMQNAWYVDLLIALGISDDPRFLFVVQEKEPPYLVTVVEYDLPSVTEGRRLNRMAINTYKACRDADTWPAYADDIVLMSIPEFAFEDVELKI